MNGPEYIPTWRLEELNRRNGGHFFDAGAKRFFRSRISGDAWLSADGRKAYFVTSEQFADHTGRIDPRRYTVRVFDMASGMIDAHNHGEFQAFASGSGARGAAKRAAEGGDYALRHRWP